MEYIVLENAITGCQELVSTAGVESATIGCVWKSNEAYVCITDCDDCSLGMVNGSATALGYNASASNNSIAIGCGNTTTCDGIAIGNQLTACCDEVLISDKVCLSGTNTIVGKGASVQCSATGATVLGANATVCANDNIAIGRGAYTV